MRQFCIGLMLLVATLCLADAEPKVPHTVKAGGSYYFALPAKQIAYGAIAMVTTSSDGRFIAYVLDTQLNRDPVGSTEFSDYDYLIDSAPNRGIFVFDRTTGQAQMVLSLTNPQFDLGAMSWVDGSPSLAIELISENSVGVSVFNVLSNKQFYLESTIAHARGSLFAIPRHNVYLLLSETRSEAGFFQFAEIFDAQFRFVRTLKLPVNLPVEVLNGQLVASRYNRSTKSWDSFEVNLQTGALSPIAHPEEPLEILNGLDVIASAPNTLLLVDIALKERVSELLSNTPVEVGGSSNNKSNSEVAKARDELNRNSLTLTTEGTYGEVIGNSQAVWHTNRSGLFLTELMPLSASQYDELLIKRIKLETVNRAKQVGTAMMIYGADYDDALPLSQDWQEALYPYMKNNKLVEGFVYLMNGEVLTEIEDISGTVIGFIETQYGTAYVRADSSVVWKDKPKPVAYLRSLEALRT